VPAISLRQTGLAAAGTVRVRIEGAAAQLGAWEIVAILHHGNGDTRVEACAPLSRSQLELLGDARALCEQCRTVRSRAQTWLLRERRSGRTLQVGSSCLKPLTGAVSVERALRRARLLAAASARLQTVAESDGANGEALVGDRYIDTATFLAQVAAVIRAQGWRPAGDPAPTWRAALQRMSTSGEVGALDARRARDVRAWAAGTTREADAYRARLQQCLANDRLSSRELALAASAVRTVNRELYREIRRAKARMPAPSGIDRHT